MPEEMPLDPGSLEDLAEVAAEARAELGLGPEVAPPAVAEALEDAVVGLRRIPPGPSRDESAFALGALWWECLRGVLPWAAVRVTWPGLASEALVPPDRAIALLPLHHVADLVERPARVPDLVLTLDRLSRGLLPPGVSPGDYAILA